MDASDIDLTGQVAFVTGGGGGIGRACALCLADMGADVAIVDVIPDRCAETAGEIEMRGGKALTFALNVMEAEPLQRAARAAADHCRIPWGRAGIDEACGQLTVFLASRMSTYITGTVIPVDGGSWASGGWVRDSENQWILPPESAA